MGQPRQGHTHTHKRKASRVQFTTTLSSLHVLLDVLTHSALCRAEDVRFPRDALPRLTFEPLPVQQSLRIRSCSYFRPRLSGTKAVSFSIAAISVSPLWANSPHPFFRFCPADKQAAKGTLILDRRQQPPHLPLSSFSVCASLCVYTAQDRHKRTTGALFTPSRSPQSPHKHQQRKNKETRSPAPGPPS